jgi:hypothetical protein
MNAPLQTGIAPELIARARTRAGRGSVMQALIDLSGDSPEMMCARVAAQLGLRAMSSAELNALTLSLERIRFSEALGRSVVVAFDDAGHHVAVVADPYDGALQDWLASTLSDSFELRVATRDDITAALARYEESQRASTGLLDDSDRVSASSAEVLSLARIADDASPVVRVVNSTLYDALKQAASDKVPHRRRDGAGRPDRRRGHRRTGDIAHQGHGRTRHRREARAAGRTLQGAPTRPRHRLPRVHHAERARRRRGHPHPRQGI